MLLRFRLENFLSFKEETEFSMFSGRSKQHPKHQIQERPEYLPPILRSSMIFGKNASGKSNLIKALLFARNLIVDGTKRGSPISIRPFKLDRSSIDRPSKFNFEILLNDKVYEYGFIINNKRVLEEWLIEIRRTTEAPLFIRKNGKITLGRIKYSEHYNTKELFLHDSIKDLELRLKFVGEDTLENELFLTTSVERKQPYFREIFKWFEDSLNIILPDSKYLGTEIQLLEGSNQEFIRDLQTVLKALDTDIEGIELVPLDFEREFVKVYSHIDNFKNHLDELELDSQGIMTMPDERRFVFTKDKNGKITCRRLMTKHRIQNTDGDPKLFTDKDIYEYFELHWESQGTQRLLDLIPMLFLMKDQSCTFVIDEIGRSLHPDISFKLIKLILENPQFRKSQLIFSSHESHLMSLDLLRKDEIWFMNKNSLGQSTLSSLEEFKPRYDKDIRRGYLNGRFGGIPKVNELELNRLFSTEAEF